MLERISDCKEQQDYSFGKIGATSDEERNALLSMLSALGAISVNEHTFKIPSALASSFIKSLVQYLKNGFTIISAWDSETPLASTVHHGNLHHAIDFVYAMEKRRNAFYSKPDMVTPIKQEVLVRIVLKRKSMGKDYILMQFDKHVGRYQLIGGIVLKDESLQHAVFRKLQDELAVVQLDKEDYTLGDIEQPIYTSTTEEDEIFLSRKFGVNVRYKTHYFELHIKNPRPDMVKAIDSNGENRWVSYAEIDQRRASDGKEIFRIHKGAVGKIKLVEPCFSERFSWKRILENRVTIGIITIAKWIKEQFAS